MDDDEYDEHYGGPTEDDLKREETEVEETEVKENRPFRSLLNLLDEKVVNSRKKNVQAKKSIRILVPLDTPTQTRCCMCGATYTGHGHNPHPVHTGTGRCCDACNHTVLQVRLMQMLSKEGDDDPWEKQNA